MNRLTDPGGGFVNGKECERRGVELYWRLKQYEDTGLSPEEVSAALSLLKAEREGRLVVLPCMLHEPVYFIEDGEVCEDIPYEVGMGKRQGEREDSLLFMCEGGFDFYGEDVGKTVFLSEKVAEEAAECSK